VALAQRKIEKSPVSLKISRARASVIFQRFALPSKSQGANDAAATEKVRVGG